MRKQDRISLRKITIALLVLLNMDPLSAQLLPTVRFVRYDTLSYDRITPKGQGRVGGLSAIEYISSDSILLVSDHDGSSGPSYIFVMNAQRQLGQAREFNGLRNVESLRYHPGLKRFYVSVEGGNSTGIRYLQGDEIRSVFKMNIPEPGITSKNRGIEGMTFSNDGALWAAFESGDANCERGTVPFYKIPLTNGEYNIADKRVFQYPIDRCSCLTGQSFDGDAGNGVSEILAIKEDTASLLVLERCYNPNTHRTTIDLWMATVPQQGNVFTKKRLFKFNDTSQFPPEYRSFFPDNLEGMCWGPANADGSLTLYLVSDDNFQSIQRTQIIELHLWWPSGDRRQ